MTGRPVIDELNLAGLEIQVDAQLRLIEHRIRSSDIEVRHRNALIRLRAMIEDDLAEAGEGGRGQERSGGLIQRS